MVKEESVLYGEEGHRTQPYDEEGVDECQRIGDRNNRRWQAEASSLTIPDLHSSSSSLLPPLVEQPCRFSAPPFSRGFCYESLIQQTAAKSNSQFSTTTMTTSLKLVGGDWEGYETELDE